jgi:hypothetical protein
MKYEVQKFRYKLSGNHKEKTGNKNKEEDFIGQQVHVGG